MSGTTRRAGGRAGSADVEHRIRHLLSTMTLEEKAGQLHQVSSSDQDDDVLEAGIAAGHVGSILNEVDPDRVRELRALARRESRLGIPLLFARDVIHGFRTVFPIPLAQAASFDPDLVEACAAAAAREAFDSGVDLTFAPMVDVARDPRWGRVAESLGEDPWLASLLAGAMVRGFQGPDPGAEGRIAACVKHFAGYGACEAGRDYDFTAVPETELRNVHLPPFRAAMEAGVLSFMCAFTDLNGIPSTANESLMTGILRREWAYDGPVFSDWGSIPELCVHGVAEDEADAARLSALAGVDVDMEGHGYVQHLPELVRSGRVPAVRVDTMVARVLRLKFRLGLFDDPREEVGKPGVARIPDALRLAQRAAVRSTVLLKNEGARLPLKPESLGRVAVIGPLADEGREQLGTWVFDGDPGLSVTPLTALRSALSRACPVDYAQGLATSRTRDRSGFAEACAVAEDADVAIVFLGEEAILSGEAHCRADLRLPGAQEELVAAVAATGTPVVAVILAGRPLVLTGILDQVEALLYAWHPGSMAGPALSDLILGLESPVARLPITLPRMTGQVPIYYGRRPTGRPASRKNYTPLDEIAVGAEQTSIGHACFHLDAGFEPLFPFGFGLSYTRFAYESLRVCEPEVPLGGHVRFVASVRNVGDRPGEELVQLYVRDRVASITRPVRELKAVQRVSLVPGAAAEVRFELHTDELAFFGAELDRRTEPGAFDAWVGGDSNATLATGFTVVDTVL